MFNLHFRYKLQLVKFEGLIYHYSKLRKPKVKIIAIVHLILTLVSLQFPTVNLTLTLILQFSTVNHTICINYIQWTLLNGDHFGPAHN